jgi:hypothetical protein
MTSLPRQAFTTAARWAAALMSLVLAAGCGESGPQKYALSGKVTYGGQPISYGDIRFEPKEGVKNNETIAFTRIRNGDYATEVVGGPHWVNIRDLTGDVDMGDPENPGGKPKFQVEYRGEVDLPPVTEVEESGTATKDIEVPTTHK